MEIKIMIVVGARPNFMKAAPIIAAIRLYNSKTHRDAFSAGNADRPVELRPFLVHTGQHYDEFMSDHFFTDLNLPKPDKHLGVGSGSHAVQTAEIIKRFDECLTEEHPEVLIVVGDVNSTIACALVAAKSSFDSAGTRPLICHVEAGLRSFDRAMPEEVNRVLTDQLADLLFVTEESGIKNLQREGFSQDKIHLVGNTMIDSLLAFKEVAEKSLILERLGLRKRPGNNGSGNSILPYSLLTIHRPSNVDNCDGLRNILEGMEDLRASCPIIFPAHPRTQKRIREFGFERYFVFGGVGDGHATRPGEGFSPRHPNYSPTGLPGLSVLDEARKVGGDGFWRRPGRDHLPRSAVRHGARKHRKAGYGGFWDKRHCRREERRNSKSDQDSGKSQPEGCRAREVGWPHGGTNCGDHLLHRERSAWLLNPDRRAGDPGEYGHVRALAPGNKIRNSA